MSDPTQKQPENVSGKWYVDVNCIDCDVCRETAPNNFKQESSKGYSFVYKQPVNDQEISQCQEALESCPVEAIGRDGE